jgi:polyisoprenyl-teichoic acid--peptidoglycan teichoic acid transferase
VTDVTPDIGAPGNDIRRRRLRLGFIALTVVSALILVTVGGLKYYVHKTVASLQSVGTNSVVLPPGAPKVVGKGHLKAKPKAGQPFTVLILGTDSRTGTTAYGPSSAACGCSDTIILARVNPQTNKVSLLSIPRDSRVNVTGYNKTTKINSAYGKGPDNTVATIEQSLNIDINHWIVLDLAGFKSIVDAIGGIKMDFPILVKDNNAGLYITKTGCQSVNGTTALAISRSRELKYLDPKTGTYIFDPTYEYGRARREQILMKVIAAHTVKKSLSNPFTAKSVIDTFTSHDRLLIDNQVTADELVNLVGDFAGFNASTMQSFTLPTYTSLIYDAGAGKKLDFEVLEPALDEATIQAWYAATLATPKPTATPTKTAGSPTTSAPATSSVAPVTTGAVKATGTPTVLPPTTTAGTGTGTGTPTTTATPAVQANAPHDFDPRPCS